MFILYLVNSDSHTTSLHVLSLAHFSLVHIISFNGSTGWLPIEHRIHFKIANITFHTELHYSQPVYLHSALHTRRSLRLSNTNLLSITLSSTLYLAHAVSALQRLQSGTLSLQPSAMFYQP